MIDDPDANLGAPCDETPGRADRAPCGHRGVALIGSFVRCAEGCDDDSKPPPSRAPTEPEHPGRICPHCYPREVELAPFPAHSLTKVPRMICTACKRVVEIKPCPRCASDDVDAFGGGEWHCWKCGDLWPAT